MSVQKQRDVVTFVLVLASLSIVILALVSAIASYRSVSGTNIVAMRQQSRALVNRIDGWLNLHVTMVEHGAILVRNPGFGIESALAHFAEIVAAESGIADVYFGFPDGTGFSILEKPTPEGWLAFRQRWYTTAAQNPGKVMFTPPYMDVALNQLNFSIVRTVGNLDDSLGVIAINVPFTPVAEYVENSYGLQGTTSFLLDDDGFPILHPDLVYAIANGSDFPDKNETEKGSFDQVLASIILDGLHIEDGKIYVGAELATTGWYVVTRIQSAHATGNVRWTLVGIFAAVLFAVVSLLGAGILLRRVKSAMQRERDANEMSDIFFNSSPFIVNLWDENLNLLSSSPQAVEMFRLSSEGQFVEQFDRLSPERQPDGTPSRERAYVNVREAFRTGHVKFEWMHQTLDGEPLPTEVTLVRFTRQNKNMVAAYTVDLRPVKAVMEREREANDMTRMLLETSPMFIEIWDEQFNITDCNQRTLEIFDVYDKEKYLKRYYDFTPKLQPCGTPSQIKAAEFFARTLSEGTCRFEWMRQTRDGKEMPVETTCVRVERNGKPIIVAYNHDLRPLMVATDEMQKANRRRELAEEESLAKTRFLARMSHEIRTPMNAIIGMAELALRTDEIDAAHEHMVTVKQAGTNLLSIINDILDISKIETGKLELVPTNYHFSTLLNDVISIIRMKIMDSQLSFVVNIDSNIPNSLYGDEVRIRQVLLNLLSNSVKYTESGFVSLRIYGEMDGQDSVKLKIEVEDSGCGIEKENIEKLFDEYYQFDKRKNKNIEGTGLGLNIVWYIVKAMNGEISAKSEYGKGSTFIVTFSQEVRSDNVIYRVENASEKSVLVHEKREIYANSLVSALESLGVECVQTKDDSDMLEKLASGNYTFAFISFPVYRKNNDALANLETKTKIVILTEFGDTVSDKNITTIAMPVHSISVAGVLNGGQESFSYHGKNRFTVSFVAPDANVLIVDDVVTNLKVVKGLLSPYGMEVDFCKNGEMALAAIKANRYDIVFMDHLMPGMDGVETTREIRKLGESDKYYLDLPIVALTANAVSSMREFFLENNFSDFMSKPVDVVKLNAILERWIPQTKRQKPQAG